ncbi:hypothetical protein E2C01_022588 [Portunus trituberculatus]|uniref:Uncharacterized protein n=1 Tax=Portunus trituberculatus TaxID=210409 RepID=A0A5B7E5R8_PORTR|nr:hypothetical protein [Portunus trituberculatus]
MQTIVSWHLAFTHLDQRCAPPPRPSGSQASPPRQPMRMRAPLAHQSGANKKRLTNPRTD